MENRYSSISISIMRVEMDDLTNGTGSEGWRQRSRDRREKIDPNKGGTQVDCPTREEKVETKERMRR